MCIINLLKALFYIENALGGTFTFSKGYQNDEKCCKKSVTFWKIFVTVWTEGIPSWEQEVSKQLNFCHVKKVKCCHPAAAAIGIRLLYHLLSFQKSGLTLMMTKLTFSLKKHLSMCHLFVVIQSWPQNYDPERANQLGLRSSCPNCWDDRQLTMTELVVGNFLSTSVLKHKEERVY